MTLAPSPVDLRRVPRDILDAAIAERVEAFTTGRLPAPRRPEWASIARPEQIAPAGDWSTWLILAGRGWGKTRTGAEWFREQAQKYPYLRIIAPTFADARDTCVEGESGLRKVCKPGELATWNRSMGEGEFNNGARFKVFSGEQPDRLRGPQSYADWCDELATWQYPRETWDMAMLGLRLGKQPRSLVTTTPRPIDVIRELLKLPTTHITRGSTYDNRANLAETFFSQIVNRYEGTRLGRQEINAELLEDVPGALWTRAMIDGHRVTSLPALNRIVVAIDPSATSKDTSDEAGIVVAARGNDNHGYILGDYTRRGRPSEWAHEAISAYNKHGANTIVAEGNNGGEMVEEVLLSVCQGNNIAMPPYSMVWAAEGKRTRAEPVSTLYEQGKVHHVGTHGALEDEQCSWIPNEGKSPNRIDALVWAVSELGLIGAIALTSQPAQPSRWASDAADRYEGGRWDKRY